MYVIYRTILDVLVITNAQPEETDDLINLYSRKIHGYNEDVLISGGMGQQKYTEYVPFHKFCVFPGQHSEFIKLVVDMKTASIAVSPKKPLDPSTLNHQIRDRIYQYIENNVELVRDSKRINGLMAYQCFLKSIYLYQLRQGRHLTWNSTLADAFIMGETM